MTETPDAQKSFQAAREQLKQSSAIQFVTAEEFYALMVSNTMLERFEIRQANVTGLLNAETGLSYVIESELLDTDRTW